MTTQHMKEPISVLHLLESGQSLQRTTFQYGLVVQALLLVFIMLALVILVTLVTW